MSEFLEQYEKAAKELEKLNTLLAERAADMQALAGWHRLGVANSHDLYEGYSDYLRLNNSKIKLDSKLMDAAVDLEQTEGFSRLQEQWEKSGRVFTPHTAIEQDIYNAFQECRAREGYRYIVMYEDLSQEYPHIIKSIKDDANLEDVVSQYNIGGYHIMVILDTEQDISAQWPYVPGTVEHPPTLVDNPVLTCLSNWNTAKIENSTIDGEYHVVEDRAQLTNM